MFCLLIKLIYKQLPSVVLFANLSIYYCELQGILKVVSYIIVNKSLLHKLKARFNVPWGQYRRRIFQNSVKDNIEPPLQTSPFCFKFRIVFLLDWFKE